MIIVLNVNSFRLSSSSLSSSPSPLSFPPRQTVRQFGRLFYPSCWQYYKVSHLLVDLGWVEFDLGVPSSWTAAQPLLPNSARPRKNLADLNPTNLVSDRMNNPVHRGPEKTHFPSVSFSRGCLLKVRRNGCRHL